MNKIVNKYSQQYWSGKTDAKITSIKTSEKYESNYDTKDDIDCDGADVGGHFFVTNNYLSLPYSENGNLLKGDNITIYYYHITSNNKNI